MRRETKSNRRTIATHTGSCTVHPITEYQSTSKREHRIEGTHRNEIEWKRGRREAEKKNVGMECDEYVKIFVVGKTSVLFGFVETTTTTATATTTNIKYFTSYSRARTHTIAAPGV